MAVITAIVVLAAAAAIAVVAGGSASRTHATASRTATVTRAGGLPAHPATSRRATASSTRPVARPAHGPPHRSPPIRVGLIVLHFTDPTRTMTIGGRITPRPLTTVVRYPVGLAGPAPLIVFGHGYNVTPTPYAPLLDAWTRAGFVVAAPLFPLENPGAPGGPNERDMPNQAGDMSLVISELSAPQDAPTAHIAAKIDLTRIAVAGQSDGGDTALAAAYDPHARDPRVRAAIILSGAEDPFAPAFAMPAHGPPLLATQGSADTINPPSDTHVFLDQAPAPKYLLWLAGASHMLPYTEPGPELAAVVRVSVAFLDRYLKGASRPLDTLVRAGSAGPGTQLFARP